MRFEFERSTSEDDRCIKSNCPYKSVEGSDYCPRHGANKQLAKRARMTQYDFKVERVRKRINLLAAEPTRYRLDEELGVLRLTLEDVINSITSKTDDDGYALFQASDTIKNLVLSIEKVAQTCVQQSVNLGLLMTREDVMLQAQQIIDVLAEEIENEETLLRIATKIDRVFSFGGDQSESNEQTLQLDYTEPKNRESEKQN